MISMSSQLHECGPMKRDVEVHRYVWGDDQRRKLRQARWSDSRKSRQGKRKRERGSGTRAKFRTVCSVCDKLIEKGALIADGMAGWECKAHTEGRGG